MFRKLTDPAGNAEVTTDQPDTPSGDRSTTYADSFDALSVQDKSTAEDDTATAANPDGAAGGVGEGGAASVRKRARMFAVARWMRESVTPGLPSPLLQ